ncbi:MAG: GFA family protein [Moraxellaceae bacterium]|nr:GFA family protein [Moraxellaceae bacterium]MDP1775219.1 GFA family protein [Moraxellaceae bacterium]
MQVRCGCGQLSLTFNQAPVTQLICHCDHCREVTMQPSTLVAFFKAEPQGVVGRVINKPYMGGSGRPKAYAACEQCGDYVYADVSVLKGLIGVIGDKILPPFQPQPAAHVWTSQRVVEIADTLPQFPKGPAVRPGVN